LACQNRLDVSHAYLSPFLGKEKRRRSVSKTENQIRNPLPLNAEVRSAGEESISLLEERIIERDKQLEGRIRKTITTRKN